MAKISEEKKQYEVRVKFDGSATATIYKPGLPLVIDKVEEVVKALTHLAEESNIEVIGEKPACWETYFPKSEPTIESVTVA